MELPLRLSDIDLADIGAWPAGLRALAIVAVAIAAAAVCYWLLLADRRAELAVAERREAELRGELQRKRALADALPEVREQRAATAAAFAALLGRLPARTEVPGLIEDITRAAVANDLAIGRIELAEERQADSYMELPIAVEVSGGYHQLGAFAAAIADLPRIVTQHDFTVRPRHGPANLTLTLAAKTYRYGGPDGQREFEQGREQEHDR